MSRAKPPTIPRFLRGSPSFPLLSALAVVTASCSLGENQADGLRIESPLDQHQFASSEVIAAPTPSADGAAAAVDADGGAADGENDAEPAVMKKSCNQLDLFVQHVTPHLIDRCIKCHDGRKLKAVLTYDLGLAEDPSDDSQAFTCEVTLESLDPADAALSTIFTEVDPDNDEAEHDFKYPNAALYQEYFDSVMLWLEPEVASQEP